MGANEFNEVIFLKPINKTTYKSDCPALQWFLALPQAFATRHLEQASS